jgi:hypothetical protein
MLQGRPPKVRKILQYKKEASKLLGRYEGKMAQLSPAKHKAKQLLHWARELTLTLTPGELCELRRLRMCG